jgi:multidrug resistance efflux pump
MWWRITLLLTVAGGLTGLLLYSQSRQEAPRVSGNIEADEIRLGSRVGGRVKEVLVEEGQTIEVGQLTVRLEEFDLDERQAQAEAELRVRQAALKLLEAGFREEEIAQAAARVERLKQKHQALVEGPREEEKEAARARVRSAQAQVDLARRNYDRNMAIFERDRGAVAREALDRSTEELKAAQANKDVREQELLLLERGTRAEEIAGAKAELVEAQEAMRLLQNGSRPEDIEQAKAAVASNQAAIAILEAMRAELEIRSPVSGVVEAVDLQPGDLVAAGAPVLSIIDTSRLWIRAFIPENRLGLQIGQKLDVTVDSFPGESFEGTVSFISRQAEFTPSNVQTPEERSKQVFRIKVDLPANDRLRPGMAADVWLEKYP